MDFAQRLLRVSLSFIARLISHHVGGKLTNPSLTDLTTHMITLRSFLLRPRGDIRGSGGDIRVLGRDIRGTTPRGSKHRSVGSDTSATSPPGGEVAMPSVEELFTQVYRLPLFISFFFFFFLFFTFFFLCSPSFISSPLLFPFPSHLYPCSSSYHSLSTFLFWLSLFTPDF